MADIITLQSKMGDIKEIFRKHEYILPPYFFIVLYGLLHEHGRIEVQGYGAEARLIFIDEE